MSSIFQIPTIDVRERIPFEVIEEVARQIAAQFHPRKIVLFGSYAYGVPRPESDVDLLVVMDTTLRPGRQAIEIRRYLNVQFGLDIIIHTPENLKNRLRLGDNFLQEIVAKGKILYESIDD